MQILLPSGDAVRVAVNVRSESTLSFKLPSSPIAGAAPVQIALDGVNFQNTGLILRLSAFSFLSRPFVCCVWVVLILL